MITKISEALSKPINDLFKTGGLGLVFIFIGLLLSIYSFIYSDSIFAPIMFSIGSFLILTSFVLFLVTQIKGPIRTQKTIEKSAETLDTLQEICIHLIYFTKDLRTYCFKNLDNISASVNASLPLIKPLLGKHGQKIALQIENISSGIVEISSNTEQVLQDLEKALKKSDFRVLKKYEKDIRYLNEQMKLALKSK